MLEYIDKQDKALCCGCRACENICPVNTISFDIDEEGFLYPKVSNNCIKCGLCKKVCPISNTDLNNEMGEIYSVQIDDQNILNNSSSGGVFRLLADYIIDCGGYVAGCVWNDSNHPVLYITNSKSELVKMQGSKYLYSDPQDIYVKVKKILKKGIFVLFTGTPCQCAGLVNFLNKHYDNLIVADFLCHGVPSQKAFDAYLKHLISRYHIRNDSGITYKFRDKEKMGWGIVSSISWMDGDRLKKKYSVGLVDSYDYAFTHGYLNRYCCYSCRFKGNKRCSDITFCDFWGYDRFYKDIDYRKGVSALTINTEKAARLFEQTRNKAKTFQASIDHVAVENPAILSDKAEDIPKLRNDIYSLIEKNGWREVSKRYFRCKNWHIRKMWYMLPKSFMDWIRTILRK